MNNDKYKAFLLIAHEVNEKRNNYVPERPPSNIISILGINENGHSAILAEVLNFKEQGKYIFLKSFINTFLDYNVIFNH